MSVYHHNSHAIVTFYHVGRVGVQVFDAGANRLTEAPLYVTTSLADAFKWSDQVTAAAKAHAAAALSGRRMLGWF